MSEFKTQNLNLARRKASPRNIAAMLVITFWQLVQATLFGCSPQPAYGWRRMILRLFGAKIGKGVIIRPTARVTYPWKVTIGDHSWVGDQATLYSLGPIRIGNHAVVSQKCYLCTGTHDYRDIGFPQTTSPIVVEDEAWVAADVFVGPGVTIGHGAVVGARSTIFKDVAAMTIVAGNPPRVIGPRESKAS